MSIHVALNHVMHYRYERHVTLGPQIVRLRPAPHCRTRILSYSLKIEPSEHFINWQQDPQSNYLARLVFPKPARELRIEVDLIAEMAVLNPFDFFLEPYAQQFPFQYEATERARAGAVSCQGAGRRRSSTKYLAGIAREPRATIDFLVQLNQRLAGDVKYLIRLEPGVQQPEETLLKRSGSCRDSAELLVQLLRHLGLAARFVSGYLIQLVADVKPLDGPAGPSRRFHRSARVVRGVPARRRLDRTGRDVGPAHRRRPHSARVHPGPAVRRAAHRCGGGVRDDVRVHHEDRAHLGGAARDQALLGRPMGCDRCVRAPRR